MVLEDSLAPSSSYGWSDSRTVSYPNSSSTAWSCPRLSPDGSHQQFMVAQGTQLFTPPENVSLAALMRR